VGLASLLLCFVFTTPSASASSLVGCNGTATSFDQNGKKVDSAAAAGGKIVDTNSHPPSPGATASNPFKVDGQGTVKYAGNSNSVITNHSWHVSVEGIKVRSGGSENGQKKTTDSGTVDVSDYNPLHLTGLVEVSGELSGTGGSCSGSGFVEITGNPLTSPLTWLALILFVLGLVMLVLSLPTTTPAVQAPPAQVPPAQAPPPEQPSPDTGPDKA
jgi:hypothetical protein